MEDAEEVVSPTNEPADEERIDVESQHSTPADDNIEHALKILDDRNWTNVEEFVNPWGSQQVTLVHLAAHRGNIKVLKRAAALHADFSATDAFRRTALHYAADQGHVDAVKWLLEYSAADESQNEPGTSTQVQIPLLRSTDEDQSSEADCSNFDVKDKDGRTPLHAAVYGGHLECIRILIKGGLSLASETKNRVTVMDAIFEQVPHPIIFLTEILDEHVSAVDSSCNKVILDFSVLIAPPSAQSFEARVENVSDLNVVLALIDAVSNMEQMAILQHPLLATFLHQKYVIAIPLNLIILFLHVIFVSFLSWHATCIESVNEGCMKGTVVILPVASLGFIFLDSLWTLSGRAGLHTHFLRNKVSMYMPMFLAMLNFFFSVDLIKTIWTCQTSPCDYPSAMLHMIAVMILLSWTNMFLVLGRFPVLGEYTYMFFIVLVNIGKVFLFFACLIIGFAFSFMILFSGADQFKTPWKALAKTLVMMTGEYDYDTLFPPTEDNNSTINNSTFTANNNAYLPVTSTIIFLFFVMVTSIGLINLMVGLAVSDIRELLKEGRIRRLMKQADSAFHWIGPGLLSSWALGYPLDHLTKMASRTMELDVKSSSWIPWRGIPVDLRKALHDLAMKNSLRNKRRHVQSTSHDTGEDSLAAIQSSLQRIIDEQRLQRDQIRLLTNNLSIGNQRRSV